MLKDLTKQFTKDLANLLHQTKPWDLVYIGEIGEIEKTPGKKRHIRYLAKNHECDIFPFTISGNRGMLLSR